MPTWFRDVIYATTGVVKVRITDKVTVKAGVNILVNQNIVTEVEVEVKSLMTMVTSLIQEGLAVIVKVDQAKGHKVINRINL